MELYDIFCRLKRLSVLASLSIFEINKKVDSIISCGIKDNEELEHIFDDLFSYSLINYDEVFPIYKKLSEYVSTFNKELSDYYNAIFVDYFEGKIRKL